MSPSSAAKQRRPGRFAEGAALSGARISGRRLRMDVALEKDRVYDRLTAALFTCAQ